MINLDTCFDKRPWEIEISLLKPGQSLSAMRLVSMLEGEEDDSVQSAFEMLKQKRIRLNLNDLPVVYGSNEVAERLRKEHTMAQKGFDVTQLEETDPLRIYLEEIAAIPAFGDEQLLAEQMLSGEQTMEPLVNLMLSLVWQRSLEYTGHGMHLVDLIQEGNAGLMEAVQSYAGGDFRSHCEYHICFEMGSALIVLALYSGVGQMLRQAMEDYRAVDERLLSELGRNATLEEIAEAMHSTPEQTAVVADMIASARQMQKATAQTEKTPDDDQAVENTADFQMLERISELLSRLDDAEARLLKLRFGLEGGKALSPEETGRKLGLTPEQVVNMEAAALAKLRMS